MSQTPSLGPSLLLRVLQFNQRSNQFYWRCTRKSRYMSYYSQQLERYLREARTAIHLGAGSRDVASLTSAHLHGAKVYAVDPSESNLERNPNPHKIRAWGHDIPLPDASVDLIFSEHVMEHVEDPTATLAEAHRLLRPGGVLLWVAPNLWSYVGLATHLTPFWFHRLVNRLLEPLTPRRASSDVYPTHFRINSLSRVRKLLRQAGLELEELYTSVDAPHYTQFLPGVHQVAVLLHVLLDRLDCLEYFRLVHVVRARKPGRPAAAAS